MLYFQFSFFLLTAQENSALFKPDQLPGFPPSIMDFNTWNLEVEISMNYLALDASDLITQINKDKAPDSYSLAAQEVLRGLDEKGCRGILTHKYGDDEQFKFYEINYFLFDTPENAISCMDILKNYKGKMLNKVFQSAEGLFNFSIGEKHRIWHYTTNWGEKFLAIIQLKNLLVFVVTDEKSRVEDCARLAVKGVK